MRTPLSEDGPIRLAVTVDDLFQWDGIPFPDGYSGARVAGALLEAFADHDIEGVYQFSNTRPTELDPSLMDVLDDWCAAGHHVGNHTHYHSSLNWVEPATYIEDIERAEKVLEPYLEQAPNRFFRYCMDMWGDRPEKTREVQTHLAKAGYTPAPLTYWFYDAQFMVPYWRTLVSGDREAQEFVQGAFVDTAVSQLRNQVAAARTALGRHPAHIALVHGTAVAADTYGRVLDAYAELGVEFISLEEAMRDSANLIPPPVTTRMFRNFTQKWAEHAGIEVEDAPAPAILAEVSAVAPVDGLTDADVLGPAILKMAEALGAEATLDEFDWHAHS